MKKSFIAIALIVLGFALLSSSSSYATAPKVGDIPDIRVPAPNGASAIFDLDDYVLDYDAQPFIDDPNMSWGVTDQGLAPTHVQTANNVIGLQSGAAAGDTGSYQFEVTDASSQVGTHTSLFKASTALGLYPALSQDFVISPAAGVPGYTVVLDPPSATGATWTTSVANAMTYNNVAGTDWQSVSISAVYDASMNAAYFPRVQLASGLSSASVAGLTASLTSSGEFTLTSTNGTVGLSMPVLVGFKGENNSDPNDWSGVSVFVSTAMLASDKDYHQVPPGFDIDDGFETAALGRIKQNGFNAAPLNRTYGAVLGPAENSWVSAANEAAKAAQAANGGVLPAVSYPSVTVVAQTDLPSQVQTPDGSFAGDHSGQALCVSLGPVGSNCFGFVQLNSAIPATAGKVYAVEASVSTDATTPGTVPAITMVLRTAGYADIVCNAIGPDGTAFTPALAASTNSAPMVTDGWVRMRTYLEPTADTLTDAADGPLVYGNGITVTFLVQNYSTTTSAKVYIDNVRVYTAAMPEDLSFGGSKVAMAGRPDVAVGNRIRTYINPSSGSLTNAGLPFDGGFERGTGAVGAQADPDVNGGANGIYTVGTPPANFQVTVDSTAPPATKLNIGDTNWLKFTISSGAASRLIVNSRVLYADASGATFTPGVYVFSADYVAAHGNEFQKVDGYFVPADDGFLTSGYCIMRYGTSSTVRRIRLPISMRDFDVLVYQIGAKSYANTTGTCWFDNVMCQKVSDKLEYSDFSLFQ